MKYLIESFDEFLNERKKPDEDTVLARIESWLRDTTEEYDDWDWDGKVLTVFTPDGVEKYTKRDLKGEGIFEKQTDPELMAQMEEELEDKSAECPRCGKGPDECTCQERDAFSTVNSFRAPSGVKKEKKNFKS